MPTLALYSGALPKIQTLLLHLGNGKQGSRQYVLFTDYRLATALGECYNEQPHVPVTALPLSTHLSSVSARADWQAWLSSCLPSPQPLLNQSSCDLQATCVSWRSQRDAARSPFQPNWRTPLGDLRFPASLFT